METLFITTIFLPLLGVGLVWAVAPMGAPAVRWCALLIAVATLLGAGVLTASFPGGGELFAATNYDWLGPATGLDIRFHVALDGISLWLFALSALLTVTAVLVSWQAIQDRPAEFYAMLLLLETGMLGVFAARDIILFYIFFEFTLIPLYFLIGIWGSEERRYAAIKFFLFTFAGSMLTFLGLLAIVLWNRQYGTGTLTFSIDELTASIAAHRQAWDLSWQLPVFLALFAGFAIKVPLFPLHTWLPLAHVQAPTAGSVILAGVLLKIGAYGFIRFSLPMLPDATAVCTPWMLWLSVEGIIYGALVALAQSDMKRLIAYSSVSHLGFCMLGLFALNRLGMQGAMLQMINHGLSTGGLFAIVGMLYERYHTRQIADLSGLAKRMPLMATMMVLFTLSSIGLPGLNGFAGEILILIGMFQRGWADAPDALATQLQWISVLALTGVVLGAWYMLYLVQRVFFGPLREPGEGSGVRGQGAGHHEHDRHHAPSDMNFREFLSLAPLTVFIFWIGICPNTFLKPMSAPLDAITQTVNRSFTEHFRDPLQVAGPADPRPLNPDP